MRSSNLLEQLRFDERGTLVILDSFHSRTLNRWRISVSLAAYTTSEVSVTATAPRLIIFLYITRSCIALLYYIHTIRQSWMIPFKITFSLRPTVLYFSEWEYDVTARNIWMSDTRQTTQRAILVSKLCGHTQTHTYTRKPCTLFALT